VAFAADRIIGFIAADLNLFAAVYRLAVLDPQGHGGFPRAEPADGLHFFNLVGVDQHVFAAFEQIVLEIIFEAEGHDRNAELIHNAHKLENAVLGQELALIYQHTVGLGQIAADNAVDICILVDRDGLLAQSDPGGDITDLVPVVKRWSEDEYRLALFLVIMCNLENLNGFAAIHCPILEKQLCHVHLSFRC
jgi:hypothetical protein